jgi:ABC-type Fe3+/spermidine/putrescine transport system ATPase subunit
VGGWHLQGPTQAGGVEEGSCHVVVRPERVRLAPLGTGEAASIRGTVSDVVYLGPLTKVRVALADTVEGGVQTIEAIVTNDGTGIEPTRGHEVDIALPPDALHVIPGDVSDEVAVPDSTEAVA